MLVGDASVSMRTIRVLRTDDCGVSSQVLKYSQSDVNRMRKEWELEAQARFLNKEKSWSSRVDEKEARIRQLDDELEKLTKSQQEMKYVVVMCGMYICWRYRRLMVQCVSTSASSFVYDLPIGVCTFRNLVAEYEEAVTQTLGELLCLWFSFKRCCWWIL